MKALYLLLYLARFLVKFPFKVIDEFFAEIFYRDVDAGEDTSVVDGFWITFIGGLLCMVLLPAPGSSIQSALCFLIPAALVAVAIGLSSALWVLIWD